MSGLRSMWASFRSFAALVLAVIIGSAIVLGMPEHPTTTRSRDALARVAELESRVSRVEGALQNLQLRQVGACAMCPVSQP